MNDIDAGSSALFSSPSSDMQPRTAEATACPVEVNRTPMIFGTHPRMTELRRLVPVIAKGDAPVLILGETGTGKEMLVRELHEHSARAGRPYLKLNCAALPSELVESELFGYERGAFTGAFQRKAGMFEQADGGTILLDEIGDMDFKLQAKLLQVLQDHQFQRLGGRETIRVNVRVIAATHRDLEQAIEDRTFRADLYYRLNVITVSLPPLRERKQDIPTLARFLLNKESQGRLPASMITPEFEDVLLRHEWPGNIRELDNVIRRLVVLGDVAAVAATIRPRPVRSVSVPDAQYQPAEPGSVLEQVSRAKADAEAEAILTALRATQWNRKQASRLLNIDYKALLYKMKKLAIEERDAAQIPSPADEPLQATAYAAGL